MSSSRWPCLLPRQRFLPLPSVWWAAFPHCGGGTGAKARSRPSRGQSGTVSAECLICRKRWPLFHARLGWDVRARRPAASCGIRRSTLRQVLEYSAESTIRHSACPSSAFSNGPAGTKDEVSWRGGMFVNHFCFAAPVSQPLQKIFSRMSLLYGFFLVCPVLFRIFVHLNPNRVAHQKQTPRTWEIVFFTNLQAGSPTSCSSWCAALREWPYRAGCSGGCCRTCCGKPACGRPGS